MKLIVNTNCFSCDDPPPGMIRECNYGNSNVCDKQITNVLTPIADKNICDLTRSGQDAWGFKLSYPQW